MTSFQGVLLGRVRTVKVAVTTTRARDRDSSADGEEPSRFMVGHRVEAIIVPSG
jgi:hypothetical protein